MENNSIENSEQVSKGNEINENLDNLLNQSEEPKCK